MYNQSLRADDWIEEMMNRYADMVYRLAYAQVRNRQDADDIFQEVFIRLVKREDGFESREHEKAWLIRVTINCARSMWLSAWRRMTVFLEDEEWNRVEYAEPNREADGKREILEEAMRSLSMKHRRVIHLFYYEEMSVEEIARATGDKPSTVRAQLTRARQTLKKKLSGREGKWHV